MGEGKELFPLNSLVFVDMYCSSGIPVCEIGVDGSSSPPTMDGCSALFRDVGLNYIYHAKMCLTTFPGWTSAFATPVYHNYNFQPTIMEMLVYWLSSCHGFAGGYNLPKVRLPLVCLRDELRGIDRWHRCLRCSEIQQTPFQFQNITTKTLAW